MPANAAAKAVRLKLDCVNSHHWRQQPLLQDQQLIPVLQCELSSNTSASLGNLGCNGKIVQLQWQLIRMLYFVGIFLFVYLSDEGEQVVHLPSVLQQEDRDDGMKPLAGYLSLICKTSVTSSPMLHDGNAHSHGLAAVHQDFVFG